MFGDVEAAVGKMSIDQQVGKVKDLRDPAVVAAIDNCRAPLPAETASPATDTEAHSLHVHHRNLRKEKRHGSRTVSQDPIWTDRSDVGSPHEDHASQTEGKTQYHHKHHAQ